MRAIVAMLGMPLLAKELAEQAARRRTYIIRVVYASLLFAFSLWIIYEEVFRGRHLRAWDLLGKGEQVFEVLIFMQFAGIYLFLPALICGAITHEKQNNSFSQLILTDLRPWEILLQKLVSRLMPMLTFVLLCLPLMGVAYALGGVSANLILSASLILLLTCLQVATFGLMLSTFCATTVQAFITCYLLGAAIYFGPAAVWVFLGEVLFWRGSPPEDFLFSHIPAYVYAVYGERGSFASAAAHSIPVMVSIALFLGLARLFVIRRALARPRRWGLKLIRLLDRLYHRIRQLPGGVWIMRDRADEPRRDPIAWRETTRTLMGRPICLIGLLILLEAPVALICAWSILESDEELISVTLLLFIWPLAVLLVTAKAAGLVASERAHQTLDVLLTTPLTGHQIIRQKMRSVTRLIFVLGVVFVTIFALETCWELNTGRGWSYNRRHDPMEIVAYMVGSLLCVFVYLPMFAWFAVWVGVRLRRQDRALIAALASIVVWCVAPVVLLLMIFESTGFEPDEPGGLLLLLSPAALVFLTEIRELDELEVGMWVPIIVNFVWYGIIALFLRWLCLNHADRYLGRVPEADLAPATAT